MKLATDFRIGLKHYSEAFALLFSRKFIFFLIFPVILNLLFLLGGMKIVHNLSESFYTLLENWLNLDKLSFWKSEYLAKFINIFITIIFKIIFFLVFAFLGGYIIIILLSPVFSYLSEKVEKYKTGINYPFKIMQLIIDVWRGIRIALRNFFIEVLYTILLFIISFFPFIGLITPVILFIISSYFYGFSFLDYTLERKKLNVRKSVLFMRKNKGLVIANGSIFSLFLLIPYCGVFLSGFISILSVIAGTLTAIEIWETNVNKNNSTEK